MSDFEIGRLIQAYGIAKNPTARVCLTCKHHFGFWGRYMSTNSCARPDQDGPRYTDEITGGGLEAEVSDCSWQRKVQRRWLIGKKYDTCGPEAKYWEMKA